MLAVKLECSEPAISYWENSQRLPRPHNILAMARLFEVTVSYMETGAEREAEILRWASRTSLTELAKLHCAIRAGASQQQLMTMIEGRA